MGTDFQVPVMRSKAIDSKTIFCITSPRTPFKSIPEIALLDEELHGCIWDKESQKKFYYLLRDRDFFESDNAKEPKEPELAGRDRINRLPKALGFVQLPVIGLTEAGKELLTSNNKEEILLRQMLKFQLPSPYHPLGRKAAPFWVKPYLEILRLIRVMGTLSFDELQIFAMQVIDYRMYDEVGLEVKPEEGVVYYNDKAYYNKASYGDFLKYAIYGDYNRGFYFAKKNLELVKNKTIANIFEFGPDYKLIGSENMSNMGIASYFRYFNKFIKYYYIITGKEI